MRQSGLEDRIRPSSKFSRSGSIRRRRKGAACFLGAAHASPGVGYLRRDHRADYHRQSRLRAYLGVDRQIHDAGSCICSRRRAHRMGLAAGAGRPRRGRDEDRGKVFTKTLRRRFRSISGRLMASVFRLLRREWLARAPDQATTIATDGAAAAQVVRPSKPLLDAHLDARYTASAFQDRLPVVGWLWIRRKSVLKFASNEPPQDICSRSKFT